MFQKKPTASEIDGVQYRRAKLWQIICCSCNALLGLTVYSLIGMRVIPPALVTASQLPLSASF